MMRLRIALLSVSALAILAMAASPGACAISDDYSGGVFPGGADLAWYFIPGGGDMGYSQSIVNGQQTIQAATTSGGAQSVGATAIDYFGTGQPYVYADTFVSMDMNLSTAKNDQGIICRMGLTNTFYGLNYDPAIDGLGLIYFDGANFIDLAGQHGSGAQPVTLKLQALTAGANVQLVGQAWSIGATPALVAECQFLVGVDTPNDLNELGQIYLEPGDIPALLGGGVGYYGAYNGNSGGAGDVDLIVDNFLARTGMAGDANLDGATNATDLNTVLSYYNQAGEWSAGDLNGSGTVDATDLNTVLSYYNQSAGLVMASSNTSIVPEPSTICLILSGFAALAFYALRKR